VLDNGDLRMSSFFQESKQYPGEHWRAHEFRDGFSGQDLEQGPANNVFAPRFLSLSDAPRWPQRSSGRA
jgi:hypothetical protein